MRKLLFLVYVLAIAISSFGQLIVRDQQYRCPIGDSACLASGKLPAFEQDLSSKQHPFSINYVEYEDSGYSWAPHELDDAVAQIKAVTRDGSLHPIIVVYAHGWENNASAGSGDVCKFRAFISGLADEYPPPTSSSVPHVIGIYLAWRGESSSIEPFKHFFSYWPRRHFAEKMGRTGIYEAVNTIAATVNDPHKPAIRENTILVFAGHSFGARVMENAVDGISKKKEKAFLKRYFEKSDDLVKKADMDKSPESEEKIHNLPRLPADLIVYINAATSSEKTIKRVKKIEYDCKRHELPMCQTDPFYVALTSTSDLPTGIIMPIANAVLPDIASDHLHIISAANSPWLHTHEAPREGCQPQGTVCFNITYRGVTKQYYLPRIADRMQVQGSNPLEGADPFWIFNVHGNMIKNHGDVWNDNVLNLITAILRSNSHFKAVSQLAKTAD